MTCTGHFRPSSTYAEKYAPWNPRWNPTPCPWTCALTDEGGLVSNSVNTGSLFVEAVTHCLFSLSVCGFGLKLAVGAATVLADYVDTPTQSSIGATK